MRSLARMCFRVLSSSARCVLLFACAFRVLSLSARCVLLLTCAFRLLFSSARFVLFLRVPFVCSLRWRGDTGSAALILSLLLGAIRPAEHHMKRCVAAHRCDAIVRLRVLCDGWCCASAKAVRVVVFLVCHMQRCGVAHRCDAMVLSVARRRDSTLFAALCGCSSVRCGGSAGGARCDDRFRA
jgi:hypothetical protein